MYTDHHQWPLLFLFIFFFIVLFVQCGRISFGLAHVVQRGRIEVPADDLRVPRAARDGALVKGQIEHRRLVALQRIPVAAAGALLFGHSGTVDCAWRRRWRPVVAPMDLNGLVHRPAHLQLRQQHVDDNNSERHTTTWGGGVTYDFVFVKGQTEDAPTVAAKGPLALAGVQAPHLDCIVPRPAHYVHRIEGDTPMQR